MPLKKQFAAEFKALTPEEGGAPGEFSALVAVYDNVDSAGDRIKAGAFDATLMAWRKSGDPIPIILAHQWNDPWAHIGYADPNDVESIPGRGLYVKKGILDIGDNPLAQQVYRLMQRKTLKEFSFGYKVPTGGERKAQDGAFDLLKLDLIEFGPCLKGVNSETELLAIKSEVQAAHRRDTGEDATLDERLTRLEALLTGKAHVELAGTLEEHREAVEEAVRVQYATPSPGWVSIEGTYTDRVVFTVNDGNGGDTTYEAPYSSDANGIVIGQATTVEITATVGPASAEAAKAEEAPDEIEGEPEVKSLDIGLLLHQQAIEALEVECHDALTVDHTIDDTNGTLDAYDRLLED